MWAIRILTGPAAGKVFEIKNGKTVLGRAPACDIQLSSQGVSKQHARIEAQGSDLVLKDLGSRNGTFVNGVQIRARKISSGDKVSFHDVLVEFAPLASFQSHAPAASHGGGHAYQGNAAMALQDDMAQAPGYAGPQAGPGQAPSQAPQAIGNAKAYVEDVILPGVYKLPEWFEFKFVYAIFIIAFVVAVTGLSAIPLVRILKTSVEQESRSHALTIAEYMTEYNRQALAQGREVSLDVERFRMAGVKKLYIIGVDGTIKAPAREAGGTPEESIVQSFRREKQPKVTNIDDETIVAVNPIVIGRSGVGDGIGGYAVVVYDMGGLAVNDNRVISLLIQTLFIGLLIGAVWYFFSYRMLEYPFVQLSRQLDKALQGKVHQVESSYQFPALEKLTDYINSALSRMSDEAFADGGGGSSFEADRTGEMQNLVELVGFPALAIRASDLIIESLNSEFPARTGLNADSLIGQSINGLHDQAFKLNVQDLMAQAQQNPQALAQGHIEFSGVPFDISAQAIQGSSEIAFFLIVLIPQGDGGGYS